MISIKFKKLIISILHLRDQHLKKIRSQFVKEKFRDQILIILISQCLEMKNISGKNNVK